MRVLTCHAASDLLHAYHVSAAPDHVSSAIDVIIVITIITSFTIIVVVIIAVVRSTTKQPLLSCSVSNPRAADAFVDRVPRGGGPWCPGADFPTTEGEGWYLLPLHKARWHCIIGALPSYTCAPGGGVAYTTCTICPGGNCCDGYVPMLAVDGAWGWLCPGHRPNHSTPTPHLRWTHAACKCVLPVLVQHQGGEGEDILERKHLDLRPASCVLQSHRIMEQQYASNAPHERIAPEPTAPRRRCTRTDLSSMPQSPVPNNSRQSCT